MLTIHIRFRGIMHGISSIVAEEGESLILLYGAHPSTDYLISLTQCVTFRGETRPLRRARSDRTEASSQLLHSLHNNE
jgi:hypothetical protein